MEQPRPYKVNISDRHGVTEARRAAKDMAHALGFDEKVSVEIEIVASELASNLFHHAGRGTLTLRPLSEKGRVGIEVETIDRGPGIADVEEAITDGFSTTRSLGYGLGTVNRLMDDLDVVSHRGPEPRTRIVCKKFRREKEKSRYPSPFDVGAATRPHPMMKVNGDAFVIKKWNQKALVAVIDGLGHGQFAHRASIKARQYIEEHYDQAFEEVFRGVGRACRATRGVVMALARFDWAKKRILFASVGNVEVKALAAASPVKFLARRGILGKGVARPHVTEQEWDPRSIVVMHTDGLRSHWKWEDFRHLAGEPSAVIAHQLLRSLAKDSDDAAVVVVKGKAPDKNAQSDPSGD